MGVPANARPSSRQTRLFDAKLSSPLRKKAFSPMVRRLFGSMICLKFPQSLNALSPMDISPSGSRTYSSRLHNKKLSLGISFTPSPNTTLLTSLRENAPSPIFLTESGIITCSIRGGSEIFFTAKASLPISFTGSPPIRLGITSRLPLP